MRRQKKENGKRFPEEKEIYKKIYKIPERSQKIKSAGMRKNSGNTWNFYQDSEKRKKNLRKLCSFFVQPLEEI